jgi:glycosyltransferase involved in cell wall biosynthesis
MRAYTAERQARRQGEVRLPGLRAYAALGRSIADDHRPETRAETRRINVLVLIPTMNVGGAETDLVRNLPLIDRTRFNITVCTFLQRGSLAERLSQAGIEVIGPFLKSPKRRWRPWLPRKAAAFFRRIRRLVSPSVVLPLAYPIARYIRKSDVDVVHAILPNAYVVAALANLMAGRRPLIMSRLSLNFYHNSERLLALIERYALHYTVDLAIGNSSAILKQLGDEGIPYSKLRLIHNGIDAGEFASRMLSREQARDQLGIPTDAIVFSSVANLFAYKGHFDLLPALHSIRDRLHQHWILLSVGRDVDGNLARLLRLSEDLRLTPHVRFLGERADVPAVLSGADIHVSASHHEGFPNNILEAMCAGLPVVATAVGGVPELVVHQRTGLLVPAKDSESMANALLLLADDSVRRFSMGSAGRARVEKCFTLERSVAALENAYSALAPRCSRN